MSVLLVKQRISVSESPFLGGLGVTYGKLIVDFL